MDLTDKELQRKVEIKKKRQLGMAKERAAKKKKRHSKSLEEHMAAKNVSLDTNPPALPESLPQPKPLAAPDWHKEVTEEIGGIKFVPRPSDTPKNGPPRKKIRVIPIVAKGQKVRVRVKDLHDDPKKQVGYYDLQRMRAGDVFELDSPLDYSETWMEVVDQSVQVNRKKIYREREEEIRSGKININDLNVI